MNGWMVNLNSGFFNQSCSDSVVSMSRWSLTIISMNMFVILSVSVLFKCLIGYVSKFRLSSLFGLKHDILWLFSEYNTRSIKIVSYDWRSEPFSVLLLKQISLLHLFHKCLEIRTKESWPISYYSKWYWKQFQKVKALGISLNYVTHNKCRTARKKKSNQLCLE